MHASPYLCFATIAIVQWKQYKGSGWRARLSVLLHRIRNYWDNLSNTPVLPKHHWLTTHRHTPTWMHCGWARATLVLHISAIHSRLYQSPNTFNATISASVCAYPIDRIAMEIAPNLKFVRDWMKYIFLTIRHVHTMSIQTHSVQTPL